jgi:hypothetical protein
VVETSGTVTGTVLLDPSPRLDHGRPHHVFPVVAGDAGRSEQAARSRQDDDFAVAESNVKQDGGGRMAEVG